jgi:hypothetical protein
MAVTIVAVADPPKLNPILANKSCGYTLRAWTRTTRLMATMIYPSTHTHLTPSLSLTIPHIGHATSATSSSAKPRVPTRSPTPSLIASRSEMTKEIEELRKTRKEMLKRQVQRRYVDACRRVVPGAKGRCRVKERDMIDVLAQDDLSSYKNGGRVMFVN